MSISAPGSRPSGLILAGGLSRRMGGGDKALRPLGGEPMLERVIRGLAPQCAGLALNANGDAARFAAFGLPVVADGVEGFLGPLAGVLAGLEWVAREAECVVTLAADTPFAPPDLVARLVEARRAAGADIAVAGSGGRRHHVVALWPVALAGALRRALVEEGVRKVESFVDRFKVAEAEWPAAPFDPFFNVNTPEDLAAAEARIASSR